jgi:hypothetical protein
MFPADSIKITWLTFTRECIIAPARAQACSRGGRNLQADLESARANGALLHMTEWRDTKHTKHHPRQSHHLGLQVIGALTNFRSLSTSIPTAWMANGYVSAVRNLSPGCNTVSLSKLAICASAPFGH